MILYINSVNFSTATTVYLDELLSEVAPDGYYSDGTNYRRQFEGVLLDVIICPSIDTVSITGIGGEYATFNGNFISNGGDVNAVRGFVYATTTNPTTANSVVTDAVRAEGTYLLSVPGLSNDTIYYVRAYAIVFGDVIYGDELSFQTSGTTEAGGISSTSLTLPELGCDLLLDSVCWISTAVNGVVTTGDIVYNDVDGTSPIIGNDKYYKISLVDSYTVLVNNSGEMTVYSTCP